MADISFLLLTFFLLTSSIDTDQGIIRRLPPPLPPDAVPPEIRERNVMTVLVNFNDQLRVRGENMDIEGLREAVVEFISNPFNDPHKSEHAERDIPNLGTVMVSRGVISLQNDHATSYEMYIMVQNELTAAFNDLRDALSRERFGVRFSELRDNSLRVAIQAAVPMAISEAEPRDRR